MMKASIFPIVILLLFVLSCSKSSYDEVDLVKEAEITCNESIMDQIGELIHNPRDPRGFGRYTMKDNLGGNAIRDRSLNFALNHFMRDHPTPTPTSWERAVRFADSTFATVLGDPVQEARYTVIIQNYYLVILDKYLLPQAKSDAVGTSIKRYMEVLLDHRAVCDHIMADATRWLKAWRDDPKYDRYVPYIEETALANIENSKSLIWDIKQAYDEAEEGDYRRQMFKMDIRMRADMIRNSEYALRVLQEMTPAGRN